jgi:hypothetical protein
MTNQLRESRTHQLDIDFNLILHFEYLSDEDSKDEYNNCAKTTYDLLNYLVKNNITFCVNDWDGPGGGNNYLTFFGSKESLSQFVITYLSEDYLEYIETI